MAKKKGIEESEVRQVTTIVVAKWERDEQKRHYIVTSREGGRYRSKKPVQLNKAYEISPVLSGSPRNDETEGDAGYYIFNGPLTLRGGTVATKEGRRS
jgi:hypothetical protein